MSQTFLPGEVLAMTAQAADRLLKLDSGDAALLYLRLLRCGNTEGLKWTDARFQSALEQLKSQGLAPELPAAPRPGGAAPGLLHRGHHPGPGRQRLHLPRPGGRGGTPAGQAAVHRRFKEPVYPLRPPGPPRRGHPYAGGLVH